MTGTKYVWAMATLGAALAWCASAGAQVWTGGGGNPNWSTAANWAGGTVPASGPNTSVTFFGGVNLSPNQDIANPFVLNSLVFGVNAGAFTLNGHALDFRTSNSGGAPSVVTLSLAPNTLNVPITVTNDLLFAQRTNTLIPPQPNFTVNGPIGGGGGLTVGTSLTGSSVPMRTVLTLTSASAHAAPTVVNTGVLTLSGASGAATNSSGFTVRGGQLSLDNLTGNNAGGVNSDRIGNVTVTLSPGIFGMTPANSTGSVESYGNLVLGPGFSSVGVGSMGSGPSVLASTGALTRAPGAVVLFTGGGPLGSVPAGPNVANVTFATAPTAVGGGGAAGSTTVSILPFAVASNTQGGLGNTFATYGPKGIRGLTSAEYATSIASGAATANNVLVSSNITGIDAPTAVNALRMSENGGVSVTGAGTLTVGSGAIIGPYSNTATIGVANLAFGSREAVFPGSGGAGVLAIDSAVTGSGGMTVNGNVFLRGANQFTGNIFVSGGQSRYAVLGFAQDSSLGASTNAVTLVGGALAYIGNTPAVVARPITLV